MNVGQLVEALKGIPKDREVVYECPEGCGFGSITTVRPAVPQYLHNEVLTVLGYRSSDDPEEEERPNATSKT